jgi:biopolymer transport protein ExbD
MATILSATGNSRFKRIRKSLHIEMTPMVDLAFLLLTFFVMTSDLMKPYYIDLHVPAPDEKGKPPEIQASKVLTLILGEYNQIYWYVGMPGEAVAKTNFSDAGVRTLLREKKQTTPGLYVLIKPSDLSRYQNTIDLLDELIIADITRYSLVAPEAEDEKLIALNYPDQR